MVGGREGAVGGEEKGFEGTGGVGLEEGKEYEGKVKWGWRVQSLRREGAYKD